MDYYLQTPNKFSATHKEIDLILSQICFHGAPAINRYKPAFLIAFRNSKTTAIADMWLKYKKEICKFLPFDYKELKSDSDTQLVLFYWPDWLHRILNGSKTKAYLQELNYPNASDMNEILTHLTGRFKNGCPDEIGIFLGYPLADVIAFTQNPHVGCIATGYWRVYSDPDRAHKLFSLYRNAQKEIMHQLSLGIKPETILYVHKQFWMKRLFLHAAPQIA